MSDYELKAGKLNIHKSVNRTKDTQPLLYGDACVNINDIQSHADDQGNVKLRIALWAKRSERTGTDYWNGNIEPPKPRDTPSDALPPMSNAPDTPEIQRGDRPWVDQGPTEPAAATPGPTDDLPF